MALIGSKDVDHILLEGRPLHNITTGLSQKRSQVLDRTDGLGVTDEEHSPVGQYMWEGSLEGFYNTGAGLAQEGLELTGNQNLMIAWAGKTIGDPFLGIDGPHGSIETLMERGKLHRTKADFKAALGPVDGVHDDAAGLFPSAGYIQAPYQAVTDVGPTNLATLDWGAGVYTDQATGWAIGYLGVAAYAADGGTNILFTIQDSANDIAYVDLIVFTQVALNNAGERVTQVAGVGAAEIERYTQLQYEFLGGAGALRSCTFAVGLVRTLIA